MSSPKSPLGYKIILAVIGVGLLGELTGWNLLPFSEPEPRRTKACREARQTYEGYEKGMRAYISAPFTQATYDQWRAQASGLVTTVRTVPACFSDRERYEADDLARQVDGLPGDLPQ
ncbi:MAG TPA: hypothetical protein VNQ77_04560 [Frankiaceae bacterium]|nr:hypothetical protein [Frankiaceae bacterium]